MGSKIIGGERISCPFLSQIVGVDDLGQVMMMQAECRGKLCVIYNSEMADCNLNVICKNIGITGDKVKDE